MHIKEILFPTDFSEGSSAAAAMALDLAMRYGARLHLLHVVYDIVPSSKWYASHLNTDPLYEQITRAAEEHLTKCHNTDFHGYEDVVLTVKRGSPHEDVVRYVREHSIDLLIMSSHSRRGLDRVLFGSTAYKIVKNCPCPVLTIKTP